MQVIWSKQGFLGSLPVDSHSFAIHQGLGSAPAESDKLRVTEHRVQVLEEPRFSLGVWKSKKENLSPHICLSSWNCKR